MRREARADFPFPAFQQDHLTTPGRQIVLKLVEETGLAPATRCLQGSIAPMEHAPPMKFKTYDFRVIIFSMRNLKS